MLNFENRRGEIGRNGTDDLKGGKAFVIAPAKIVAARVIGREIVNFLVRFLTHITNIHIAGLAVEAEPPGVTQSVSPNLGAQIRLANKWITGRVAIKYLRITDIQAENFA